MKNPFLFRVSAWITTADLPGLSRLVQIEVVADDSIQAHDFAIPMIESGTPNIISYGEISITSNHKLNLISTEGIGAVSDTHPLPSCSR